MAKARRGGRVVYIRKNGTWKGQNTANASNTATATVLSGGGGGAVSFGIMTDADAQQIRDDVDSRYTPSVRDAIKQYIADNDAGQGYSTSQWLNLRLENDMKLNANEKYVDKYLQQGMHDLGKDAILTRACHQDVIQNLGVKDYSKYSETQLNQMLVGATWTSKAYGSASYDKSKNPFITGAPAGGREVFMNIKAKSDTKCVFGAKKQAEIVLNKGTNYRVTGVHYDGTTAYPRNGKAMPRLIVDVEIY